MVELDTCIVFHLFLSSFYFLYKKPKISLLLEIIHLRPPKEDNFSIRDRIARSQTVQLLEVSLCTEIPISYIRTQEANFFIDQAEFLARKWNQTVRIYTFYKQLAVTLTLLQPAIHVFAVHPFLIYNL